jgi:tRNA (cmo5U34)-methyltransferase
MAEPEPTSASAFTRDAVSYDATRRGLIPCFDAFYGSALDLIADWRGDDIGPLRVLDLGSGTGLFAALLLERHPDAALHLLDGSEGMLAEARRRFGDRPAIRYILGDMATADLGGDWDLVISALAIHHLDDTAKQSLYRRIRDALRPGGLFVNAEQVLGPTPEAEERYARFWLAQVRASGTPEAEIGKARDRMRHDQCATVEAQLEWLREAGFGEVDCSFKAWRFAVLSGRRADVT